MYLTLKHGMGISMYYLMMRGSVKTVVKYITRGCELPDCWLGFYPPLTCPCPLLAIF